MNKSFAMITMEHNLYIYSTSKEKFKHFDVSSVQKIELKNVKWRLTLVLCIKFAAFKSTFNQIVPKHGSGIFRFSGDHMGHKFYLPCCCYYLYICNSIRYYLPYG